MQLILYDLRKNQKKMTQQDIAKLLKISVQTYRLKEKGEASFTQDEMFEISDIFGKPIGEIFLPRLHQNGDKDKSV